MNHRWSENSRTHHTTVRICMRCDMRQRSRHEFQNGLIYHWKEFYRGTDRIECDGTPKCEPVEVEAV